MIAFPVLLVVAQAVAGPMQGAVERAERREVAEAGERREMEAQGAAVARKYVAMGFDRVRLWRGRWMVAAGVLTESGAADLQVEGGAGKAVMLATQSAPGGWVMGFLSTGGGEMRTYLQGPGRVTAGQAVKFKVAVDGGAFFGYDGEGAADGTVHFKLPQAAGRQAKFRFGAREVVFDIGRIGELWWGVRELKMPEVAVVWAEEKTAPPAVTPEPPPALRLK